MDSVPDQDHLDVIGVYEKHAQPVWRDVVVVERLLDTNSMRSAGSGLLQRRLTAVIHRELQQLVSSSDMYSDMLSELECDPSAFHFALLEFVAAKSKIPEVVDP